MSIVGLGLGSFRVGVSVPETLPIILAFVRSEAYAPAPDEDAGGCT